MRSVSLQPLCIPAANACNIWHVYGFVKAPYSGTDSEDGRAIQASGFCQAGDGFETPKKGTVPSRCKWDSPLFRMRDYVLITRNSELLEKGGQSLEKNRNG